MFVLQTLLLLRHSEYKAPAPGLRQGKGSAAGLGPGAGGQHAAQENARARYAAFLLAGCPALARPPNRAARSGPAEPQHAHEGHGRRGPDPRSDEDTLGK